jgi:hypothetical protein
MRAPFRFSLALAGLIVGFGVQDRADAGFIPVSRDSSIDLFGIAFLPGRETETFSYGASTTELTETFSEILAGHYEIWNQGETIGVGDWNISQDTTISSDVIASSQFQYAQSTANIWLSPVNRFVFEFRVDSATRVLLEGSISGSSDPGAARVQLRQGTTTLFDTNLGDGTFPFATSLDADVVYTLVVEVSGFTSGDQSYSAADATLSIVSAAVPEPTSLAMGGLGIVGLMVWTRARDRRVSRARDRIR